jgi:hypothetical protein
MMDHPSGRKHHIRGGMDPKNRALSLIPPYDAVGWDEGDFTEFQQSKFRLGFTALIPTYRAARLQLLNHNPRL